MSLRSKLGLFVLTAEEQRTVAFIMLALILGLATQHYRHLHPRSPAPVKTENQADQVPSPAQPKTGSGGSSN